MLSIDPAGMYYTTDYIFADLIQRQLVTYPREVSQGKFGINPVPDAATAIPTAANGLLTNGGKTYTFHIKPGIKWQTGAPVTSTDFARGIARVCNPVKPFGALTYWETAIVGFKKFCDGEQALPASASAIGNYVKNKMGSITGMKTPNPSTIVFTLPRPESDFLNVLALADASASPASYLKYLPNSPALAKHLESDGPYIITKFNRGVEYDFARNPQWQRSTDQQRPAYVNKIQVITNLSQEAVQQQIQAHTADMEWNTFPSPVQSNQLYRAHDPGLHINPTSSSNPWVAMNTVSPTDNGALKKLAVRQAIEYATNPTDVLQALGGTLLNIPLHQILPRVIVGGTPSFNLYPYNVAKAKQLLTQAGYPHGVNLKLVYTSSSTGLAKLAQTLQSDYAQAGIHVKLVPARSHYDYLIVNPNITRKGNWDLSLPGWGADWDGNAARTYMVPLYDGPPSFAQAGSNYGDYNDPKTNALIAQALKAPTAAAAAPIWHQADVQIMKDAPVVPLTNQQEANYVNASRVHNFIFWDNFQDADPTQVWLS
jgi:peptide/nickel transport system substrate-binding protein